MSQVSLFSPVKKLPSYIHCLWRHKKQLKKCFFKKPLTSWSREEYSLLLFTKKDESSSRDEHTLQPGCLFFMGCRAQLSV